MASYTITIQAVTGGIDVSPTPLGTNPGDSVTFHNSTSKSVDIGFTQASWPFSEQYASAISVAGSTSSTAYTVKRAVNAASDSYEARQGTAIKTGEIDIHPGPIDDVYAP